MTLAHYVRKNWGQFWLVLETRNDASGFLFWRHCGYVGHGILFIISEPAARWKFLKHGEHVPFIKRKRLRILSEFSCDFAKFLGYISLYVLFLKNGSMNHIEIWPRALPNWCASIPVMIIKDLWIYDGRNYWWALIVHDCRSLSSIKVPLVLICSMCGYGLETYIVIFFFLSPSAQGHFEYYLGS